MADPRLQYPQRTHFEHILPLQPMTDAMSTPRQPATAAAASVRQRLTLDERESRERRSQSPRPESPPKEESDESEAENASSHIASGADTNCPTTTSRRLSGLIIPAAYRRRCRG